MAPVLNKTLTPTSLPYSPLFSPKPNTQNRLILKTSFLNQDWAKRLNLSCSGLKLKADKRGVFKVRCEASAVAEKEVEDGSGETYEYQAEVSRLMNLIVHSLYIQSQGNFPQGACEVRWGRVEETEPSAADGESEDSNSDSTCETETEVVEPSEVRTESDPWSS